MKKVLSLAIVLTLVFVMAVPAFAAPAKDNKNQDFTGTPIDVVVDTCDPIYIDDAVQIQKILCGIYESAKLGKTVEL